MGLGMWWRVRCRRPSSGGCERPNTIVGSQNKPGLGLSPVVQKYYHQKMKNFLKILFYSS